MLYQHPQQDHLPSATITHEQYYSQEPASDDYYGPETGDYTQAYEQAYDQGYDYTSYAQDDYQQDPTFDPAFDYDAAPPNLVFGSVAPTPSVTETCYTTPPSVPTRGRPPIRRVQRGSRVSATATHRGDSTSVRGQSFFTTPRWPVQRRPPPNTSYQRTPLNVQDNQQQQQEDESNYPPVRPRRQTAVQSQQSVTDDSFDNQNNGDDGLDEMVMNRTLFHHPNQLQEEVEFLADNLSKLGKFSLSKMHNSNKSKCLMMTLMGLPSK